MRALVVLTVFLAPLAFGSVHTGPLLAVCAVSLAAGLWSWRRSGPPTIDHAALALGVLTGITLLQLVPLPHAVLRVVSAGSVRGDGWAPIGLRPVTSLLTLATLACWWLLFVAVRRELDGPWPQRLKTAVIAAGTLASIVGLVQNAAGTTTIYGLWRPRYDWAVYGPFVNRNHFAGYVLLGVALTGGRVVEAWHDLRRRWRRRRQRRWLAILEPESTRVLTYLSVVAVMGVAIVDSSSRGALLAAALAFLLFLCALWRRRGVYAACAVVAVLALTSIALVDDLRTRVVVARGPMWSDAMNVVPRFPILGSGLETFALAYRPVQTGWTPDFIHHAHNEYLQMWIETGPLGLAALLLVVLGALRTAWRRGPEGAPLVAALAAVALHNIVDFNWHIPATVVTWTALAALAMQERGPEERPGRARG